MVYFIDGKTCTKGSGFSQKDGTVTFRQQLLWALIGWLAGIGSVLVVGLVILPAVLPSREVGGEWLLFSLVLAIVSPIALLGGWVGGRIPREGGSSSQITFAAIVGLLLALPVSCIAFWYAGWGNSACWSDSAVPAGTLLH
ncbi:hypothetical protein HC891_25715 [Candidatus Gracilibacteria bacterium]|nr:hypothetical protein [Candidatus Gracilibacteria bacterium]